MAEVGGKGKQKSGLGATFFGGQTTDGRGRRDSGVAATAQV